MSNPILCRECNTSNAPGSKFCNNCGSRLTPVNNLVCPNCQTTNPTNRFYCDNCGTRLVQDKLHSGEKEPKPEEPRDPNTKAFSLPTRKPGDTGELDPTTLPDWLRTGKTQSDEEPEINDSILGTGKLPRIEELRSEKKETADLPEWLVSEQDSEPIIDSPKPITTEYFQDLLSESEKKEILPTDDTADVENANLPDWLISPAQSRKVEPEIEEDYQEEGEDLSDWFSEFDRSMEIESEESESPRIISEGDFDWLAELGPAQTELFSKTHNQPTDHLTGAEGEIPDWMAELGPLSTNFIEERDTFQNEEAEEPITLNEDEDDWKIEFDFTETDILSLPSDSPEIEAEEPGYTKQDSEDWLMDIPGMDTNGLSTPLESSSPELNETFSSIEERENWLADLSSTDTDLLSLPRDKSEIQPVELSSSDSEGIADWLSALSQFDTGTPSEGDFSESDDLIEPDLDQGERLPEWLDHTGQLASEMSESEESLEPSGVEQNEEETIPDWLADTGQLIAGLDASQEKSDEDVDEPDFADSEILPDWLDDTGQLVAGLEVAQEKSVQEVDEPDFADSELLPDWLGDTGQLAGEFTTSETAAPQDDVEDWDFDEEEEIPDWLADTGQLIGESTTDETTVPSDEIEDWGFDEEEEIPDWLADTGHLIGESTTDETAVPSAEAENWGLDEEEEIPDRLEGTGQLAGDSTASDLAITSSDEPGDQKFEEEGEIPDWLAQTGQLDGSTSGDDHLIDLEFDDQAFEDVEEIPDWLAETGHLDASKSAIDQEGESVEEIPDWLAETGQLDAKLVSDLDDTVVDEVEDFSLTEDLSDWMNDLESVDEERLSEFDLISTEQTAAQTQIDEDLSDWMSELDSSEEEVTTEEELPEWVLESDETDLLVEEKIEEFDDFPESDIDATKLLTSWFKEAEDVPDLNEISEASDSLEELFPSDKDVVETRLDWLVEPEEPVAPHPPVDEELLIEDEFPLEEVISSEEISVEFDEDFTELEEELFLTEEPDWLSQIESKGLELTTIEDEISADEFIEEITKESEEDLIDSESFDIDEIIDLEEESDFAAEDFTEEEDDWLAEDTLLDDILEGEEVPDWLDELGPPVPDQEESDEISKELISSGDLPEWVSKLKPVRDSDMGSLLPSALASTQEDADDFADISDEFGEAELPEWLQEREARSSLFESIDTPVVDSLDPPDYITSEETQLGSSGPKLFDSTADETDSEWSLLLGDLPPARPLEEDLVQTEIPEWVQKLKPKELSEEELEQQKLLETKGPLAGMRGVINIEPIISIPREGTPIKQFTVTKEQQQQVALLRQISHEGAKPTLVLTQPIRGTSTWARIVLASLLILIIGTGLLVPDLVETRPLSLTPAIQQVNAAINTAAGKPILVAVEFTPGMAGELNYIAETLISQAGSNNSPVITVSQYAAGIPIATELLKNVNGQNMGLIPGEAIGLRQLGNCIGTDTDCHMILGRPIDAELQQTLGNVGLIILLTGERDSLISWIEQVSTFNDTPIVVGITESLEPIVSPYQKSNQLQGVIVGTGYTAVYQQEFQEDLLGGHLQNRLNAQIFAQILGALLLVIGGIAGIIKKKPR